MNYLKTILFIVLCLAVGVGIGQAYIWLSQPAKRGFEKSERPPLITGLGDAPAHRGFALKGGDLGRLDAMLKEAQSLFATTIGIEYAPDLTREALTSAADAVHRKSLAIILLPAPVFAPQNPYPKPLAEIAADAQAAGVDYLCVSWLNTDPDADYWRQQAQAVRAVFNGKIVLAGQTAVLPNVACWDAADIIGAVGPIPLAKRLPGAPEAVTVHDMRVAWDCSLTSLESLAQVNKKKLALLNMNVPVEVSARLPSADAANVAPAKNPALQQTIYEALLLETKGRAEMTDALLFNWGDAGQADAPNNVPGLLPKIGEAWDPKKPRPVETAPADDGGGGADDGAGTGNPGGDATGA
jgi:hypothetical protein